jgi:hypothetical protein
MEKPFALIIDDDRDISALFRHVPESKDGECFAVF